MAEDGRERAVEKFIKSTLSFRPSLSLSLSLSGTNLKLIRMLPAAAADVGRDRRNETGDDRCKGIRANSDRRNALDLQPTDPLSVLEDLSPYLANKNCRSGAAGAS